MTSPIDITPDHLEIVRGILRDHMPLGARVWVFGGRGSRTTIDSSGLNLALEGDRSLSQKSLGLLKDAFAGSDLPYSVDVVDLNRLGDSFRKDVKSQIKPLVLDGDENNKKLRLTGSAIGGTTSATTTLIDRSGEWHEVTLGDLIDIVRGRSYRSVQLHGDSDTALVTLKSFKRGGGYRDGGLKAYSGLFNQDQIIRPGEMVVAQTDITQNGDVVGRPAIVPQHPGYSILVASLDVAIVRIIDTKRLDSRFLYYRLLSKDYAHHARSLATGTTVLHLARDAVPSYRFLLPPLDEQCAIAHVLGTLDVKIELNRRMNETLVKIARALFKSWFVDFDPVRAKMEDRWRRGESLPGLPADLYYLFPDRLVDSELGEIPEGWGVEGLGTFGEIITGKTPSTKSLEYYGEDVPFLRIPDMHGNMYAVKTEVMLSVQGAESQSKKTLPPGSVSVSCIATPGLVVLNHRDTQTNQQINSIIPNDRAVSTYLYWTCCHLSSEIATGGLGGSVFGNMNKSTFSALLCIHPEPTIVRVFDALVSPIHEAILVNEEQTHTLSIQQDVLLPTLVSG